MIRTTWSKTMVCLLVLFTLIGSSLPADASPYADLVIPPTWDIVSENFESGNLTAWSKTGESNLALTPGVGRNGSIGLKVTASASAAYLSQSHVTKAAEGYLTFWLNPNNVALPCPAPNYWPPGTSLGVAEVRSSASDWWPPLIGFYLRKPAGQGYKGYLAWPKAGGYFRDYESGQFDLANGWQKITLGYHVDAWVAVWVNDVLVQHYTTDVVHDDPYGDVIELGKVNENSTTTPGGSIYLDDIVYQVPRFTDLWVDAEHGNDANDGLSSSTAYRTIQRAADFAGPGTTVHLLPGVYRESVWPAQNGSVSERVIYRAENGPGTVIIRGSEPSSSLTWTQLPANTIGLPPSVNPTNLYYADLSAWNLSAPPRFITQLDANGNVTARLPLAREPDWSVTTEWKYHEFWWAADGGSSPATCDPTANEDVRDCDLPQRSLTQLTDRTNDTQPLGVEAGNLTALGDLTGATVIAIDTYQGHYTYRRTITAHDVANGRITVDRICEHDGGTGNPGLGWGTKYYVEGKPRLLDNPGEWWYDAATKRLYLWPLTAGNPATQNIEVSRRDNGFSLQNRSYTTLDGLTIELLNGTAVYQRNWTEHKSYHNTVRNATLRYANWGVSIEQSVSASSSATNVVDGFTLEDSEIAYIDTLGIRLIHWWENNADPDSYTRSGVHNTVIRNNEMHHLGFRTDDNAVGLSFGFTNKLIFEGNHVHHVAHNGVQFSRSVIQSNKTYGFAPGEIKTGEILIKDNIFEKACQQNTDCGALKFWGAGPQTHVFRDVLITGNIFRNTYGWSYIAEKRHRYTGGDSSQVRGLGGYGLFVDHASGLHAYRNIAYNNAYADYVLYGVFRDGDMVYWNNIAANSLHGFSVGGPQYDTHGSVNTQLVNNLVINNEGYGVIATGANPTFSNVTIDHNLYFNNGWRPYSSGGEYKAGDMVVSTESPDTWTPYPTLAEVQADTIWEDHGVEGDPTLWTYTMSDHDLWDGSWPDFHLTPASLTALDRGAATLPASLTTLLNKFGVSDWHAGTTYDIGRYEGGFDLQAVPSARSITPGGTTTYTLHLYPPDLPQAVTLTIASPLPGLTTTLSAASIAVSNVVTLTAAHDGVTGIGQWFNIPVTGSGGGFTQTIGVQLLVGGMRVYLPVMFKNSTTSGSRVTEGVRWLQSDGPVAPSVSAALADLPLLTQASLTYLGAFSVPHQDGNDRPLGYGGHALAYDPARNGLFFGGHDWYQELCEIGIPPTISLTQTASILQNCTDATEGRLDQVDDYMPKLGGTLVYNGRLIISAYGYYDANYNQILSHFAASLTLSQTGDIQGPYQVGDWAGIVSGYMTTIPLEWRSALGGPALTGQCCIPIISRTSAGPAVSIFDPDDVGHTDPVSATVVLAYPLEHPLAAVDTQNDYFNLATQIVGIAFPPGTRSVLFFGRQGIGPYCYGTGAACNDPIDDSKGTHAYPYVHQVWAYDALDLLAVKNGQKQSWAVQPYALWRLGEMDDAGGARIVGTTYDSVSGRIYITESYGEEPAVHVYQLAISENSSAVYLPLVKK